MTKFIRYGLLSLILAVAAAATDSVRVVASSDLQLVIVDSAKSTPAREAMHKAFAASLSKAVSDACGGKAGVQMKCQSADQAAFGLTNGHVHAIFAIAKTLPHALVLGDTSRLTVTLGADKNQREAYLIFSNDDPGLDKVLRAAFTSAVADSRFLDAYDGGIDAGDAKEATLASR